MEQTPVEKIRQRRAQMLVHSYLYYWCDEPIISDDQWQTWADELERLHAAHGWQIGYYDDAFSDWTGATGTHLPRDDWVINKATRLLRHRDRMRTPNSN